MGKKENKKEKKRTDLYNPSLVVFGPVNDEAVEHDLPPGNQDGRRASEVAAWSTTIFNFEVDRFA